MCVYVCLFFLSTPLTLSLSLFMGKLAPDFSLASPGNKTEEKNTEYEISTDNNSFRMQ